VPIQFSEDPAQDRLVNTQPLAFLIAMLLDQQIPLTWAFNGPNRLVERLGQPLDAAQIAAMDPHEFVALAKAKPAIHRYPKAMAGRIQLLCQFLVDHHNADAGSLWRRARKAEAVQGRLADLPGFGPEKVKITIAVLVKRFDLRLSGWEEVAAPFSDDQPRSVADVGSPEGFARVKAWKKAQKDAGLDKHDAPAETESGC